MKKKMILFTMLLMTIFITKVSAHDTFKIGDDVYFDPVSNKTCDETNFWTLYNQDSTCYRFFVINAHDNSNEEKIKVIMDHDVAYSTFNEYGTELERATENWKRFTGTIDIIDENTVAEVMKLGDRRPTKDNNGSINGVKAELNVGKNDGPIFSPFVTNLDYYQNGKETNNRGFWTKDSYDDNWAYVVNRSAHNYLFSKTSKAGVRPVINIDKKILKKRSQSIDISNDISLAYKYLYTNSVSGKNGIYPEGGKNYTYKQFQSFTITSDKLVFAASNMANPNYGVIFSYNGDNYKHLIEDKYTNIGHGNGMTYNNKTNEIIIVGQDNYQKIQIYDNKTMNLKRTIDVYDKETGIFPGKTHLKITSIGYDEIHDMYVAEGGRKMFILDNEFKVKYSFESPNMSDNEDIEYKDGYIYQIGTEINENTQTATTPCNAWQLYCLENDKSGYIYVYNAKLNSDGTPTKDFGRLVKKIYVEPNPQVGEIESISFKGYNAYLGYAAQLVDKEYTYKIYEVPYSKIGSNELLLNVNTKKDENSLTYNFTSSSELKEIEDFELSPDKKTLSIKLTQNTDKTIKICDIYNTCSEQKISFEAVNASDQDDNKQNNNPHTGAFVSAIALIGFILILIIILLFSKKYRRISRL